MARKVKGVPVLSEKDMARRYRSLYGVSRNTAQTDVRNVYNLFEHVLCAEGKGINVPGVFSVIPTVTAERKRAKIEDGSYEVVRMPKHWNVRLTRGYKLKEALAKKPIE